MIRLFSYFFLASSGSRACMHIGSRFLSLRLIFYTILPRILFRIVPGPDVEYEDSKQSTDGEENNDEDEDN